MIHQSFAPVGKADNTRELTLSPPRNGALNQWGPPVTCRLSMTYSPSCEESGVPLPQSRRLPQCPCHSLPEVSSWPDPRLTTYGRKRDSRPFVNSLHHYLFEVVSQFLHLLLDRHD